MVFLLKSIKASKGVPLSPLIDTDFPCDVNPIICCLKSIPLKLESDRTELSSSEVSVFPQLIESLVVYITKLSSAEFISFF